MANDRPNIVLVMTDQQRADFVAGEGFQLDTMPFVDCLAAQGVPPGLYLLAALRAGAVQPDDRSLPQGHAGPPEQRRLARSARTGHRRRPASGGVSTQLRRTILTDDDLPQAAYTPKRADHNWYRSAGAGALRRAEKLLSRGT